MALLIPEPLLHLHASQWALLYLLQHTALGQKRPLQSYRSVPLRILQPKYHTLPFYKTPPYYKQITSAVRTSRAGTKTGSRNYISPCAACEWASSSGGGVPQRHPRLQNDGQIIFFAPRLSYLPPVRYDNSAVYTCLKWGGARFALSNLANVWYAYEAVGRDLN